MAAKPRKRRGGVLADALHKLIEERHPNGLPVGQAAADLYGSDTKNHRERVYRLAGALRKNNILVYSFGGRYYLCNEDGLRLSEVAVQRQVLAASMLQNAFLLTERALEIGLPKEQRNRLEQSFNELKNQVLRMFG
ncbi:MAG: hypothetical protein IMW93_06240 [Thermoanaerobacteraceae bacterium]|nr:hypothetical protein [Thermoanaerobacteraceae bacterium]